MSQPIHIAISYLAQDQNTKPFSAYEINSFRNKSPPITDERQVKTLQGVDMLKYLQKNGAPILAFDSESYQDVSVNERIIASHFDGCSLRTHEQATHKTFISVDGKILGTEKNVCGLSLDILSDDEAKAKKFLSRLEEYILGSG